MFIITYRKYFLAFSAVAVIFSALAIAALGLKLGIDFTGGALTEVAYTTMPEKAAVVTELDALNLGGYSLREAGDGAGQGGYLLRTRDLSETERVAVSTVLTTAGEGGEVARFNSIGPVIGQELKDKAIWAIGAVALMIVLYVAFAFRGVSYPVSSWVYGIITIVALMHDVLLPTAMMAILGHFIGMEVDVLFVMALLAVLGYSVNDTIVVFDRVRENLVKFRTEKKTYKKEAGIEHETVTYTLTKPFAEVVGASVQETFGRSINTSFTTLLTLGALYVVGGAVTQTFALVLIVGVLAGTYSSIFLASPLLVYLAQRQQTTE